MTEARINDLVGRGFKRWQKNGKDRLYINAGALGLECSYYKTGNISNAWFDGERISNSHAYRLKDAKTYIDLANDTIVSDYPELAAAVAEILGVETAGYGCRIEIK